MTDGVKLTLFDSWIELVTLIDRNKLGYEDEWVRIRRYHLIAQTVNWF